MNPEKITIYALVQANISTTWDAYTQPEHITKWNFASEDWQCPTAQNDMQVGGKYMARMEAKDGSWGFDFEAIYDEVIDGKEFTYTMLDGRKANVVFDEESAHTKVTVSFDAESENPVEMQRGGWQAILNNFKKYVETSH